ncbi:MAG TPA: TatD family hydrolase [Candidatus Paceibacterota bacterium]
MNPKFFDAHTHLHDKAFDSDRAEVWGRMKECGVRAITVGTDLETSRKALSLAREHEELWAAIGLHPNDNKEEEFNPHAYAELAEDSKVVAIGECGLDYYRGGEDGKKRQKNTFEAQIAFAVAHDKPLMIHCRPSTHGEGTDAHEDTLAILAREKEKHGEKIRGVIHFFTAGPNIATRYLGLGFYLSFPGVVTFTEMYDESVRTAPLNRIFSETDAPYAAPMPYRGKRNEPSYVRFTLEHLAQLKSVPPEDMRAHIGENAKTLFGIPFA